MIKKILIVLAVVVVIVLVGFGILVYRLNGMAGKMETAQSKITGIDLRQVKDGTYQGEFSEFVVGVKVAVTVKNHKINKIDILKQDCGPGYEAKETVDRILKAQLAKVEAVSGASTSSRCIMIAVDRALQQGMKPAGKK